MESFRVWNKEENREEDGTLLIDKYSNIYSVNDKEITKLDSLKYCIHKNPK